ncbi:hypothetical protein PUNSTDRAFT_34352, partial [Punctularia strigosozonata HHB-11173 SS5]|uniref:uncharacterized protein n=1 Tax=Punctularia strigosozonata (strain HHB-11173) TaxID=741275 RepID=UPI0004417142
LGYWCPRLKKGFQCRLPVQAPSGVSDSLYWEILAVVSALDWAKSHGQAPLRLLIYCDNKQTVKLFNSMKARRPFVEPMKAAVDILLENSIELRVLWIAGNENTVADALSRFENDLVRRHAPDTVIRSFTPPRSAL